MRPEWHRCEKCYFFLVGKEGGCFCHYDPYPLETVENSFCSRWMCSGCGGHWDDDESHSECMTVAVELN